MSIGQREPFPGVPPPLTARPEGLLSLLGIQNAGRYPQHFDMDYLRGSLDLLRWYAEADPNFKSSTLTLTMSAGSTVFDANLTVPAGEYWMLLQASVLGVGLLNGQHVGVDLIRANSSGGSVIILGQGERTTLAQNAHLDFTMDPDNWGMMLRPSVQVGLRCFTGPAGNANWTVTLRYLRLNP